MDYWIIALQILVLLGFTIYGWFIKSYFPAYFQEKAKYLAQKEDIKEITEKIQEVNTRFAEQLEWVKSRLSFLQANRLNYKLEERKAILDFSDSVYKWIYGSLDTSAVSFDTKLPNLYDILNAISQAYSNVNVHLGRIRLLIHNKEIIKEAEEFVSCTLEYSHYVQKYVFDYYQKRKLQEITEQEWNSKTDPNEKAKLYNSIADSIKEIGVLFQKFNMGRTDAYLPVSNQMKTFTKSLQNYFEKELSLSKIELIDNKE